MRIATNTDVTSNPRYGPPPSIPALFSLPETLASLSVNHINTVVLCIEVVPGSDVCRVSGVSN